ncbi:unnamed protein product [Periconia digitata]|uniref:FAR1 domain-containing protein n=1 Tax=Periconia digitata TaxID=1303443 RepID=A0A9W4URR1_9PLEO|nr:unnamed protein product [Periconia digitata]
MIATVPILIAPNPHDSRYGAAHLGPIHITNVQHLWHTMRPAPPPHMSAGPPTGYAPLSGPQYPAFPSSLSHTEPSPPVNRSTPVHNTTSINNPAPINRPEPVDHPAPVNQAQHTPGYQAPPVPGHHHHRIPQYNFNQPPIPANPPSNLQYDPSNVYISPYAPPVLLHAAKPASPDPAKPTSKNPYPHIQYTPENFPPAPPIPPNTAPEGHFDMLPPAPSTHSSWEILYAYAQEHASIHGYAFSISSTDKSRLRVKLCCVCYGKNKNTRKLTDEQRVRRARTSNKTGCRMNLECKKHPDGNWTLRIRHGAHNHAGKPSEAWALQRRRTWAGAAEGRSIGTGGILARVERSNGSNDNGQSASQGQSNSTGESSTLDSANHSLKLGSPVWKIIEQEMLTKLGPGHGRDRGVGRTVRVLQERLPGISIFKRDIYNVRAEIRRLRKEAGQEIGEGLGESEQEGEEEEEDQEEGAEGENAQNFSQLDPGLVAQCDSVLHQMQSPDQAELEQLRNEVRDLRGLLDRYKKDLEEKNSENAGLRMQVELANMAMYNVRGAPA